MKNKKKRDLNYGFVKFKDLQIAQRLDAQGELKFKDCVILVKEYEGNPKVRDQKAHVPSGGLHSDDCPRVVSDINLVGPLVPAAKNESHILKYTPVDSKDLN